MKHIRSARNGCDRDHTRTPKAPTSSRTHLARLAAHLPDAMAGDTEATTRLYSMALRLGLAHSPQDDLSLIAAVVCQRIRSVDEQAIADLHKAVLDERIRRDREPAKLEVPTKTP